MLTLNSSTFFFVAGMVIPFGRYGLFVWPMWSWPIWFVGLWPIWSVADMVQTRYNHSVCQHSVWNHPSAPMITTLLISKWHLTASATIIRNYQNVWKNGDYKAVCHYFSSYDWLVVKGVIRQLYSRWLMGCFLYVLEWRTWLARAECNGNLNRKMRK